MFERPLVAVLALSACASSSPVAPVAPALSQLALPPAPSTGPLLRVEHLGDPDAAWPELVLAPQIACEGESVLVPLEATYGGERSPVAVAILDRAGHAMTTIDLDALVPDEFDARDVAAVRRKLDAANARLAQTCWRPLELATAPDARAWWNAPTVIVTRGARTARIDRPDLVRAPDPDDDCPPTEQVTSMFVDAAGDLALVRVDHAMHDNCGSLPPSWVVVASAQ